MTGLIRQLRVSLLVTLGFSVFDLADALLHAVWSGGFLAALGDWGLTTLALCVLVAAAHSTLYGVVRLRRRVRERHVGPGHDGGTTRTARVD
ncbi:hypothetical protein [Streptomyces prunicolor]|uniref:hypothetical protein n=1 Tax=Streptomyces prunicolor TaxID=67348 RepID=UPI0003693615|nr:hypothetical protein [Streptomyces prunicolor]